MTPESDCPVILLASGQTLKMRKVMLYDEEAVKEITSLRSTAAFCLLNTSPVTGVLGSPAWSLLDGASAVTMVPGMLSGTLQKQAVGHLQEAHRKAEGLTNTGRFFDAADLAKIHIPHPQAWSCAGQLVDRQIDVSQLARSARDELLQKHNKTTQDIIKGTLTIKLVPRYIHNGDEFVNTDTDFGMMSIRWSNVVAYFPPQPSRA